MTSVRFFFYGSMSEGMICYSKIKDFVISAGSASIRGEAYRLKVGFPVVVENQIDKISGTLVELRSNELLMSLMDAFFGVNHLDHAKGLHYRATTQVQTENGVLEAWTYFLNPKKLPKDAIRLEGGDWFRSLTENPPLTDQLSEKHVMYIKKLGAASGRDIVPINDLTLYRELMKLELIVDKGRRLALSKLGQEVYRHLP